jgi:apolipoprotein N-acyltransferase
VLQGQVQGRWGTTPYAWWAAHLGLWPLWGLALAVLGAALLARRQRGRSSA